VCLAGAGIFFHTQGKPKCAVNLTVDVNFKDVLIVSIRGAIGDGVLKTQE